MGVIGKGMPTQTELETQAQLNALQKRMDAPAFQVPACLVANLPSAAKFPNAIVRIIDTPQGTATSNGTVWISDVDGTNLGVGNV